MKLTCLLFVTLMSCGACAPPATIELVSVRVAPERQICRTKCGLTSLDIDCRELQEMESRALWAFERRVKPWSRQHTCEALEGWTVMFHQDYTQEDHNSCAPGGWVLGVIGGETWCAGGLTHMELRAVEISTNDLQTGPLAHELAHVLDLRVSHQIGHCEWTERGIARAIRDASGKYSDAERESERRDCTQRRR